MEQSLPFIADQMNPVPGRTRLETISVFIADHPVVRYGVSTTLGGESSDGWQAIAKIQQFRSDVVFLELDLPSVPGTEMLKDIEVVEITSAIRIVHSGEVFISPSMACKLVSNFLNREKADRVPDSYQGLSTREREVLSLLADGMNNHSIAEHLSMSPYAVQTYRQRVMRKLDLHSGRSSVVTPSARDSSL